jgi:hypothetical protein
MTADDELRALHARLDGIDGVDPGAAPARLHGVVGNRLSAVPVSYTSTIARAPNPSSASKSWSPV